MRNIISKEQAMAIYSIGIDLGTTNSSLSYIKLGEKSKEAISLPIPQLINDGELFEKELLPSFVYLPAEFEIAQGALKLPWSDMQNYAVGELARKKSITSPSNSVASAKSWLCNSGIDRRANSLPWGGGSRKISPIEAEYLILEHMKSSWNSSIGAASDELKFENQLITITVPASFDEVARELTAEAAERCGIAHFSLLEEPQAAFYNWILQHESDWKILLRDISTILVCDVGGGTTDFSLIQVVHNEDGVQLKRIAVGDHLLLGGDNMDMAIAVLAEKKSGTKKISAASMLSLSQECRSAKELLLSPNAPSETKVTLLGRGSKLIGGAISVELLKEEIEQTVLDGFFPELKFDAKRNRERNSALSEWGLPYEKDPAITGHLLDFIRAHSKEGELPDCILFNGGVFTPETLRDRISKQLEEWKGTPLQILQNRAPELAVSAGAAYFGVVRDGDGVRIGGGSPRSYYVKLDENNSCLCLIPKDIMTETAVEIKKQHFNLLMNRPVSFSIYSSSKRAQDAAGDIIPIESELVPLPPLALVVKGERTEKECEVYLSSTITELGTLDLKCVATEDGTEWKLKFELSAESRAPENTERMDPEKLKKSKEMVEAAFSKKDSQLKPNTLFNELELLWGEKRELFSITLNRNIFDMMLEVAGKRRGDKKSEGAWFNIAGFTLRPGYGFPLDSWRIEKISPLLKMWLQNNKETKTRMEWWIFWRRCAAGLSSEVQTLLFQRIEAWLLSGKKHIKSFSGPEPSKGELAEIIRMAAVLEKIDPEDKLLLLDRMVQLAEKSKDGMDLYLWSIGRIGARNPIAAAVHNVISGELIAKYLEWLLQQKENSTTYMFALSRVAALTGDRYRDIDEELRDKVVTQLKNLNADSKYIKPVTEIVKEELEESVILLGDSLPLGLSLVKQNIE